jgi:hypothetical protein
MKIIYSVFVSLMIMGCKNNTKYIESNFNKQQQKAVSELIQYFKKEVCNSNYSEEIFNKNINKIKDSFLKGEGSYTGLNHAKLVRETERLNSKYQLNIFKGKCSTFNRDKNLKLEYYCISSSSEFMSLLKDMSILKKNMKNIYNEIKTIGVLSSNSVRYLLKDDSEFDINSEDELLALAVCLMQCEFQYKVQKLSD